MVTTVNGASGIDKVAPGTVAPEDLTQPLTLRTAKATTSGTYVDFTDIPSWVKRITVMFNGVSTNGSSLPVLQIGTSGGIQTAGYNGCVSEIPNGAAPTSVNISSGFGLQAGMVASVVFGGTLVLNVLNAVSGTWVASGVLARSSNAATVASAGSKTLSGTLDRIRFTTVNGTDTFDAGSINILYEG